MVLHPINPKPCPTIRYNPRAGALPVWTAIAERQKQCAESWWLIAQPDHAGLSGDLASNFVSRQFPKVDAGIAKAIALHDAGWAMFPPEANPERPPMISEDFKPRSFIEFPPQDFLRAWTGSIERAEQICPAGGAMVSRHFASLAQFRLRELMDGESDQQLIRNFLDDEAARQQRLSAKAGITPEQSPEQSNNLLKVLQFCDVLSLYLCCGADEEVEFPQRFGGKAVRLKRNDDLYVLTPSPFQDDSSRLQTLSLGVAARKYPSEGAVQTTTLPFLLQ
jgi:hypothetical protein